MESIHVKNNSNIKFYIVGCSFTLGVIKGPKLGTNEQLGAKGPPMVGEVRKKVIT